MSTPTEATAIPAPAPKSPRKTKNVQAKEGKPKAAESAPVAGKKKKGKGKRKAAAGETASAPLPEGGVKEEDYPPLEAELMRYLEKPVTDGPESNTNVPAGQQVSARQGTAHVNLKEQADLEKAKAEREAEGKKKVVKKKKVPPAAGAEEGGEGDGEKEAVPLKSALSHHKPKNKRKSKSPTPKPSRNKSVTFVPSDENKEEGEDGKKNPSGRAKVPAKKSHSAPTLGEKKKKPESETNSEDQELGLHQYPKRVRTYFRISGIP